MSSMNEETALLILNNSHKCRTIAPIELIGDNMVGYQYRIMPNQHIGDSDDELCEEMNNLLDTMLNGEFIEIPVFIGWAEQNVHMSYHKFTELGGTW